MVVDVVVRQIEDGRGEVCDELLRTLPLWFGIESAIQAYVKEVEEMPTFVAYEAGRAAGFVSLCLHNEYTAEIHVMAVRPEFPRKGIGRILLKEVEAYLKAGRYEFLSVKTLSPSRPNKEYELTRKFYLSNGFRPVEEFKTLWGEANPCLMMIKTV